MRSLARLVPNRTIAWFFLYTIFFGMVFTYPAHVKGDEIINVYGCKPGQKAIKNPAGKTIMCISNSLNHFFFGVGVDPGNPSTTPGGGGPGGGSTPPDPVETCQEKFSKCNTQALADHTDCWVGSYADALKKCYEEHKYRSGGIPFSDPDMIIIDPFHPGASETYGQDCVDNWMTGSPPGFQRSEMRFDGAGVSLKGPSLTWKKDSSTLPPGGFNQMCQDLLDKQLVTCAEDRGKCKD